VLDLGLRGAEHVHERRGLALDAGRVGAGEDQAGESTKPARQRKPVRVA
jgi:hypothetical protein